MGAVKQRLTDYKNFWLVWLSCAGSEQGVSLFSMQSAWGIRTNYLYHNEAGLGRQLFRLMAEQGFVGIAGKKIRPAFGWIPSYIADSFRTEKPVGGFWSPELVVKEKWPQVQAFMERYRKYIFDPGALRILYRDDRDVLGTYGRYVFQHLFLYVLFSNLIAFSKRYNAEIVARMMSTAVSLGSGADVLNYMYHLHSRIGGSADFPVILQDEEELSRALCSLRW